MKKFQILFIFLYFLCLYSKYTYIINDIIINFFYRITKNYFEGENLLKIECQKIRNFIHYCFKMEIYITMELIKVLNDQLIVLRKFVEYMFDKQFVLYL